MGPRFTCRAKKTAKHRKAPFWLSELCQFVVSQWNKLCSFTACFIHGASSIWSKALLAASRSTVKPPATGGHPLKNQDRIENSVSGYRKAQFDFPSTSAWGLANPPGLCKARDEAGSRLKHGRYFTVEGRNQWEKVKNTALKPFSFQDASNEVLRWGPCRLCVAGCRRQPALQLCIVKSTDDLSTVWSHLVDKAIAQTLHWFKRILGQRRCKLIWKMFKLYAARYLFGAGESKARVPTSWNFQVYFDLKKKRKKKSHEMPVMSNIRGLSFQFPWQQGTS